MSIRIVKEECEVAYDCDVPLEEQAIGSKEIIVDYEPSDKTITRFLSEVERISKTGIETKLSIKVNHNNNIFGFKVKQCIRKATNDITLNEIIKLMVLSYSETDKKLEEMATQLIGTTR